MLIRLKIIHKNLFSKYLGTQQPAGQATDWIVELLVPLDRSLLIQLVDQGMDELGREFSETVKDSRRRHSQRQSPRWEF
jgi:hypothetical protein